MSRIFSTLGLLLLLMVVSPVSATADSLHAFGSDVQFGCGTDTQFQTPEICYQGKVVGVYVDDSNPDQAAVVAAASVKYGYVVAGISMSTPGLRYTEPGVVNAQEWYPYNTGYPLWEWGTMPRAQAYIIQWDYPGFAGVSRPTRKERRRLLRQVLAQNPELVLLY